MANSMPSSMPSTRVARKAVPRPMRSLGFTPAKYAGVPSSGLTTMICRFSSWRIRSVVDAAQMLDSTGTPLAIASTVVLVPAADTVLNALSGRDREQLRLTPRS